jgi:hypothetical protein
MGLIFYEIITGNEAFSSELSAADLLRKTQSSERPQVPGSTTVGAPPPRSATRVAPAFTKQVTPEFALLIERCWHPDSKKRPSAGEVLDFLQKHWPFMDPPVDIGYAMSDEPTSSEESEPEPTPESEPAPKAAASASITSDVVVFRRPRKTSAKPAPGAATASDSSTSAKPAPAPDDDVIVPETAPFEFEATVWTDDVVERPKASARQRQGAEHLRDFIDSSKSGAKRPLNLEAELDRLDRDTEDLLPSAFSVSPKQKVAKRKSDDED